MKRILADILLVLSALYLPWWVTLLVAAALFFRFKNFIELPALGFLLDMLYGVPLSRWGGFQFMLTALMFAAYALGSLVKRRMLLETRN